MAVRKRPESGNWEVDFRYGGKRYRRAVRTARNKSDALEVEKAMLRELHEHRYSLETVPTLKQYSETYMEWAKVNKRSWRTDEYHCSVLKSAFGDQRLSEITPFDIEKFKIARSQAETPRGNLVTKTSINRHLEVLSKMFSLAARTYSIANPCRQVEKFKVERKPYRTLTPTEEEELLKFFVGRRKHLLAIVMLSLNTGLRPSEILRLRIVDIDLVAGRIKVENTKTSRARFVPLNATARIMAEKAIAAAQKKKSEWLFPSPRDPKKHRGSFKKAFRAAVSDAKLAGGDYEGNITPYKLRHTFASRIAVNTNGDVFAIKTLLGHSSMQTSVNYVHLNEDHLRNAVQSLDVKPAEVKKLKKRKGEK